MTVKPTLSVLACAALIAGCGSSSHRTRTSLIGQSPAATGAGTAGATAPAAASSGTAGATTSAAASSGTAGASTSTGPLAVPTTTAPAPTTSVPASGPLNRAQFASAANAICQKVDSEARSLGGAPQTATPQAAKALTALVSDSRTAVSALGALAPRGSAASRKALRAFVGYVEQEDTYGAKAAADAASANQSDYATQLEAIGAIDSREVEAGKALAPACAEG